MNVLTRKLWRTIGSTRGQFLAVAAVVTVGITVYIAMSTAYYNLNRSQAAFYGENDFADYYFHVVRAPQQIIRQVEAVPGVEKVTGRIQKDVPILKEDHQRATARLISYPLPVENEINRFRLEAGRLFEKYPQGGGIEVLVDPKYFDANLRSFNDEISIVAEGKQVFLTVTGTATSPETIYTLKDAGAMMPDPATFGIIMLPHNQAEQILGLNGEINQVVITIDPGGDEKVVADQVKEILKPYGNLAAYPRKDQLSHAILQGEIDSLKAITGFMPAIFLGIAAAIQFIMLGRMVKVQRLQIGVMKAMGYTSGRIMFHYTGYALAVALAGALPGILLGLGLATAISVVFAQFFSLPETIGGVNYRAVIHGLLLAVTVSLAAGLLAVRGVTRVRPAESMRPELPGGTGRMFLEGLPWIWQRLDATWKMSLRAVNRKRGRFGVTLLGVVFAVGLLVMSLFMNDAVDYMIRQHFFEEQRYDLLVRFSQPVQERELSNISRLEGVVKTEPLLEIPAKIHFNGRSEDDLLLGLPPDTSLKKMVGNDERQVALPEDGFLVSARSAKRLGLRTGDRVEVETLLGLGPPRRAGLMVTGVNRQLVGSGSYISLDLANRVMQESGVVSGAMLKVDPGQTGRVERELSDMTGVSSISSKGKELDNLNQSLGSMVFSVTMMVVFAALLGFAIVYNASVISFAERRRELATLRVVGFTNPEVSSLLFKENLLQSLLGVALGLPFGNLMTRWYVQGVSTDLYTLPIVIYPQTYFFSALGGIVFITVAHFLAARGISRLELVEVLKNSD
jgi:putative ABC transport system permease protein